MLASDSGLIVWRQTDTSGWWQIFMWDHGVVRPVTSDATNHAWNCLAIGHQYILYDKDQPGIFYWDLSTVTLFSGAKRFRDSTGGALDGNGDGTPGDNYQTTFTVGTRPTGMVQVSAPDFARGAGQPVNVPNAAAGLPIRLDNAGGLTSLAVDVVYDQRLLQITAATLGAGLPADWSVVNPPDTSTPGVAKIRASGTTPLSGTKVDVVRLTAAVPADAPYGASQAIRLENTLLNGGAIAVIGDVAVHKAAYLGDADGSGIHSSADAFLTVQAALGLASGFAAHAWTDPRIVGDADGSEVLSAADAFLTAQEGLGLDEPFVPNNPHIGITPVGGGVDPQLQIGVNLPARVGGLVSVPVNLDIEEAATNVGGLDFDLFFDAFRLSIQVPGGVSAGADTADGWAVAPTLVAAGHWRVAVLNPRGQSLTPGVREIARLQFRVDEGTAAGAVALDIEPVDPLAGGHTWTAVDGSVAIAAASVWHNAHHPLDVNGDGVVTSLDALAAIKYLHSQSVPVDLSAAPLVSTYYYDVNDDQACTPLDILLVINQLNVQTQPVAEGEPAELEVAAPAVGHFVERPSAPMARTPTTVSSRTKDLDGPATGGLETFQFRVRPTQGFSDWPLAPIAESGRIRRGAGDGSSMLVPVADGLGQEFEAVLQDLADDIAQVWNGPR